MLIVLKINKMAPSYKDVRKHSRELCIVKFKGD